LSTTNSRWCALFDLAASWFSALVRRSRATAGLLAITCPLIACRAEAIQEVMPIAVSTKLAPADAQANGRFGVSVALDNDLALVGANPYDGSYGAGSAYLFHQSNNSAWRQLAKLTPSDGQIGDGFGNAVALSGSTAIIGAVADSGSGPRSGSVYVYQALEPNSWTETAKLTAANPFAFQNFGQSVAIDSNTAIVGAFGDGDPVRETGGSAFIFEKDDLGVWTQTAKLKANDAESFDGFGVSVGISGNTAIVGTYLDDNRAHEAGSAYIFERNNAGDWVQTAKLIASDAGPLSWFAWSVGISGGSAIVGALQGSTWGDRLGKVYMFRQDGHGTWTQEALFTPSNERRGLGTAVAISGDVAIAGALSDDAGQFSGSALAFHREDTGVWTQTAKYVASDAEAGDHLGFAVALSGNSALVGAFVDDNAAGVDAGSAFAFNIPEPSSAYLFVRDYGTFLFGCAPSHVAHVGVFAYLGGVALRV
jgi:hypothetical protein